MKQNKAHIKTPAVVALHSLDTKTALPVQPAKKRLRVTVPNDFPDVTQPDWRELVKSQTLEFMEIAAWKGAKRLAENVMETIKPEALTVATAIAVDKLAVLSGQPTSFALVQHHTVNHRAVMERIKQAKQPPEPIEAGKAKT